MEKIHRIAEHYSLKNQLEIYVEECAEFIQAVQKTKREYPLIAQLHLCEEVADVLIMAEQVRFLLGESLVDSYIDDKLDRQLERIKNEP